MGFLGGLDICGGWIEDSWDLKFVKSRSTTRNLQQVTGLSGMGMAI